MKAKSAARPTSISPQSSERIRAVLPVPKQKAISAGTSPSDDSMEIMRRMPSGCTPEPGRPVGAEDDALQLPHLARRAHRVERGALVAVVDDLEPAPAALADAADLAVRQAVWPPLTWPTTSVSASSTTAASIRPGAGDRGTARVDGRLDAVLPRPAHHAPRRRPVLDAAETHLAEQGHARLGEVLEVLLDHVGLDHGSAGVDLHAAGAERP